jgi:hypothetical protein
MIHEERFPIELSAPAAGKKIVAIYGAASREVAEYLPYLARVRVPVSEQGRPLQRRPSCEGEFHAFTLELR